MRLNIARGAVLTGPSRIALEYARSLIPGSTADLSSRSWVLAHFGDVQANLYRYRDDGKMPWNKSESARPARFQSQKRKKPF